MSSESEIKQTPIEATVPSETVPEPGTEPEPAPAPEPEPQPGTSTPAEKRNKKGRSGRSRWSVISREMGLGGLTQAQAARGALFQPDFQDMPDPLAEKDTLSFRVYISTLSTLSVYCTVHSYIYSCMHLSTLSTQCTYFNTALFNEFIFCLVMVCPCRACGVVCHR